MVRFCMAGQADREARRPVDTRGRVGAGAHRRLGSPALPKHCPLRSHEQHCQAAIRRPHHRQRAVNTTFSEVAVMPRRSVRRSAGSAASAASKRPSSPQPAPKRQSKRAKVAGSSKATPAKSQYFEQEQEPASAHDSSGADDAAGKEESGYEDEDATGTGSSSDSDAAADDDAYSSDDRSASRKRGRPQKPARVTKTAVAGKKGKELWRTGVDTGLEPGTKLVIKKPKPREAGATPYTDDTIHPNTLLFLQDLAKNNDREWLKSEHPPVIHVCPARDAAGPLYALPPSRTPSPLFKGPLDARHVSRPRGATVSLRLTYCDYMQCTTRTTAHP